MPNVQEILNLASDLSERDKKLIAKAYDFAEKAHEGQKRMSGEPYFIHPFETAKNIARLGMDAKTISAGLLHDVMEDANVTKESMDRNFGEEITFIVEGVTKLGKLKYRGHERHVESLRKFFLAMTNDLRVVVVKLADRLHNLRTLQYVREDKRKRIALEAIEVYAPLADRLGMGRLKGDLEDAAFPFAYPKEYAEVQELIKGKKEIYEKNLNEFRSALEGELKANKIKAEITYRLKHNYSIWRKLLKHDMDIEKIYDIVALRVVVDTVEECYRILGIVHSLWRPLLGRIKDYIAVPKPNGYRSLHTTVFTGSGGIAEIQIKTKKMHQEAEYGIAAHFTYKEGDKKSPLDKKSKFKWIEELKAFNYAPEEPKKFLENLKTDFFSDRIFIFTPKGDVIDLPENSSPVDFAYAIHSDIGDHISGVKINGKMSQILSKLKNGDIVEIIAKKDAHPSGKWLDHSRTNIARKHVRSYLEKNSLLAKLKSLGRGK